jgi:hypothetical protein
MTHLRVSLQLSQNVESVPVTIVTGGGAPFPSVDLDHDRFFLMPAPGADLATALRRLADRVDDAMAAHHMKAVA